VSVVVRARESRAHGEGTQSMRAEAKPVQRAMYVATQLDKSWLLDVQRKLYARSWNEPVYVWRKLWGLVTDRRNLGLALERVARNRGARSAGVDGLTVRRVLQRGADDFVERLRGDLRSGSYRPSPVRRVLIPKAGQPGKFRPLGIPTVKDRVVQAAVKNILEPIFEADFREAKAKIRGAVTTFLVVARRGWAAAVPCRDQFGIPRRGGEGRGRREPYRLPRHGRGSLRMLRVVRSCPCSGDRGRARDLADPPGGRHNRVAALRASDRAQRLPRRVRAFRGGDASRPRTRRSAAGPVGHAQDGREALIVVARHEAPRSRLATLMGEPR
jgi:hypothetical protein